MEHRSKVWEKDVDTEEWNVVKIPGLGRDFRVAGAGEADTSLG